MDQEFANVYDDEQRARAYSELAFPRTYSLAFRDLPDLFSRHVVGRRAVDFGCGAGRSTRFLRELGFSVVGVDIARAMLQRAREVDPAGDYRHVQEGNLTGLPPGAWDLVLSAFTFDNIPTEEKGVILAGMKRLLGAGGRIVNLVSSPEIYVHEWASFSTKDHPENHRAASGGPVRIVMLDGTDQRPVEDILCTDAHYRELFNQADLTVIETHRPLATGQESVEWKSETEVAPWTIYVLGAE